MEVRPVEIPRRLEVIRAYQERGGLVAAVLPIRYPRALLRAFDILPVEVWGPPGVDESYGVAHLQPYVCSIVRNALSFLQMGGLDVVDLIIVPHACDSLQGLGSILIDFIRPRQPVIPLYLPRGSRESDVDFLVAEFRSLHHRLEEISGCSPSDAELMESIRREEATDVLLAELHRRRRELPLADRVFYRLVRAREYLPAEIFSELACAVDGDLAVPFEQATEGKPSDGVPLLLSGIVPEPMSLFESITEVGGMIVADDLACCGRRLYPPGTSEEAFRRMAESILDAPPDPTRGSPIQDRLEHLLNLIQASGAKGVLFYDVKFCEPELFDLPNLQRGLQDAGIPSATMEMELNEPLSMQALTRLEALIEMSSAGLQ